ncbi:MAG: hypothetical protein WCV88_00235 [Patescibacteria group bacterium]
MTIVRWVALVTLLGVTVLAELSSWAWPALAFCFFPSWVVIAVLTHVLPWSRIGYVAVVLGLVIDIYAPTPFGMWMIMLLSITIIIQLIHTTWVKQASALSVFVTTFCASVAVSILPWLWQLTLSTVTNITWWHWPVAWLVTSSLTALIVWIIPSRYERLV